MKEFHCCFLFIFKACGNRSGENSLTDELSKEVNICIQITNTMHPMLLFKLEATQYLRMLPKIYSFSVKLVFEKNIFSLYNPLKKLIPFPQVEAPPYPWHLSFQLRSAEKLNFIYFSAIDKQVLQLVLISRWHGCQHEGVTGVGRSRSTQREPTCPSIR